MFLAELESAGIRGKQGNLISQAHLLHILSRARIRAGTQEVSKTRRGHVNSSSRLVNIVGPGQICPLAAGNAIPTVPKPAPAMVKRAAEPVRAPTGGQSAKPDVPKASEVPPPPTVNEWGEPLCVNGVPPEGMRLIKDFPMLDGESEADYRRRYLYKDQKPFRPKEQVRMLTPEERDEALAKMTEESQTRIAEGVRRQNRALGITD